MKEFKNKIYKKGYFVAKEKEILYASKNDGSRHGPFRKPLDYLDKKNKANQFFLADGSKNESYFSNNLDYEIINSSIIKTIKPNISETKNIKVKLNSFKSDLEMASVEINNHDSSKLDIHINSLINKYGTLQHIDGSKLPSLMTSHSNRAFSEYWFDREYKLWNILLTKFIPSIYSFIKSKNNLTVNELNLFFEYVKPVYMDTSRQAFDLISSNLAGAVAIHHKTSSLQKSPVVNCKNCSKEINQNQGRGRPSMFCNNNNKCKMQFYRQK